jgi:hypothetical protein
MQTAERFKQNPVRRGIEAGFSWRRFRASFGGTLGASLDPRLPIDSGKAKNWSHLVKNEHRQQAGYDRLGTDAAADLRLPRRGRRRPPVRSPRWGRFFGQAGKERTRQLRRPYSAGYWNPRRGRFHWITSAPAMARRVTPQAVIPKAAPRIASVIPDPRAGRLEAWGWGRAARQPGL